MASERNTFELLDAGKVGAYCSFSDSIVNCPPYAMLDDEPTVKHHSKDVILLEEVSGEHSATVVKVPNGTGTTYRLYKLSSVLGYLNANDDNSAIHDPMRGLPSFVLMTTRANEQGMYSDILLEYPNEQFSTKNLAIRLSENAEYCKLLDMRPFWTFFGLNVFEQAGMLHNDYNVHKLAKCKGLIVVRRSRSSKSNGIAGATVFSISVYIDKWIHMRCITVHGVGVWPICGIISNRYPRVRTNSRIIHTLDVNDLICSLAPDSISRFRYGSERKKRFVPPFASIIHVVEKIVEYYHIEDCAKLYHTVSE